MLESFFIMTGNGDVLIEKHWRGLTSRTVCDHFWVCLLAVLAGWSVVFVCVCVCVFVCVFAYICVRDDAVRL